MHGPVVLSVTKMGSHQPSGIKDVDVSTPGSMYLNCSTAGICADLALNQGLGLVGGLLVSNLPTKTVAG